jgi:hypothetical protein
MVGWSLASLLWNTYPTVDGTIVVCFESHLIAGLGIPLSKFLVAVMSHLGCEPIRMPTLPLVLHDVV